MKVSRKQQKDLNIFCETRKVPTHNTGQRVAVAGLNKEAVSSRIAELVRQAQRAAFREYQERKDSERETQTDFDRRFKLAQSKGKDPKGRWNVSGKWEISCPDIESEWGAEDDTCSLEISCSPADDTFQVYGSL